MYRYGCGVSVNGLLTKVYHLSYSTNYCRIDKVRYVPLYHYMSRKEVKYFMENGSGGRGNGHNRSAPEVQYRETSI